MQAIPQLQSCLAPSTFDKPAFQMVGNQHRTALRISRWLMINQGRALQGVAWCHSHIECHTSGTSPVWGANDTLIGQEQKHCLTPPDQDSWSLRKFNDWCHRYHQCHQCWACCTGGRSILCQNPHHKYEEQRSLHDKPPHVILQRIICW
jgi:hypothetical protein